MNFHRNSDMLRKMCLAQKARKTSEDFKKKLKKT